MSDDYTMGEFWHDVKAERKECRAKNGIDCSGCREKEPKRIPITTKLRG